MESGRQSTSFNCQRCRNPVRLDPEFFSLKESHLTEMTLPLCSSTKYELDPSLASKVTHWIPPLRFTDFSQQHRGDETTSNNGFTIVGEEANTTESFSHNLRMTAELMDLLSSTSSVDHPLCQDCCDALIELLESELASTESEVHSFKSQLSQLQAEHARGREASVRELEAEVEKLHLEGETLEQELAKLAAEEAALQERKRKQDETGEKLAKEEEKYYAEYARYKVEAMQKEDELRSLENQCRSSHQALDKIRRLHPLTAAFNISTRGSVGIINGLRLARMDGSSSVEWWEINGALGQVCFLMSALAKTLNITFERFELVPFGNASYVKVLVDGRTLPLFTSGGLLRGILDRTFDSGMAALLDCLCQMKNRVEQDGDFRLPHLIDADKARIDDGSGKWFSVKSQLNSEEHWTKALKSVLNNLRYCLAWVSQQQLSGIHSQDSETREQEVASATESSSTAAD